MSRPLNGRLAQELKNNNPRAVREAIRRESQQAERTSFGRLVEQPTSRMAAISPPSPKIKIIEDEMKLIINKPRWEDKEIGVRLEAESIAEAALLLVLGKRVKNPVKTFGYFISERVVLDIRIPLRKQSSKDDEFGNQP
jgi:hypothetical protein